MKVMLKRIDSLEKQMQLLQNSNPLWGKHYIAIGDSFTAGDFSHWTDKNGRSDKDSPVIYDSELEMYKTYPWHIAQRNQMKLTVDALCGSTMALDIHYLAGEEGKTIDSRHPFAYKRYLNIPEDADYCTIWFGLNDSRNTNLGTIEDKTNETFYGAWNIVLSWILENRPYTKTGVIITNGGAREEFLQATRDCARKWGVPYLDMVADYRIPGTLGRAEHMELCPEAMELRRKAFHVAEDNWHPNLEAHLYHSYIVEAFLRSI